MTRKQIEEKASELAYKCFPDEENIWARDNVEKMRCKAACEIMADWALSHQWVSVEDEMPKNSETVLIRNKNGGIARATYGTVGRFDTGNVINDVYAWILIDVGVRIGDSDVTHWMPIPPLEEKGGER